MNKAYFMSFVLAAALPAMAVDEQYGPLFTGVSGGQLVNDAGGTWVVPEGATVATTNETAVAFETTSPIKLTVTAEPADTNTIAKVDLEVTLADVGNFMNVLPDGAQVAFCVCTNSFNAWNGSSWVALDEVPAGIDESQTTNLTVEISYQGTNNVACKRAARFTVGDTTLVTRDGSSDWVELADSARAKSNLAGFGINGEGIIAQADASVMLGVAEYAGVKYGTISNAVEVAKLQSGVFEPVVEVIRDTNEDITPYLSGGNAVHIDTAGDVAVTVSPKTPAMPAQGVPEGASGEYTATVDTSVLAKVDTDNIKITLPGSMSETKEIDPNAPKTVNPGTGVVTFGVRTKSSIVAAVSPAGKALSADVEKLHAFLGRTEATKSEYESATASTAALQSLLANNGGNGIPLYQSYALGIDQGTSVKPVTIPDDTGDNSHITLSIPALVSSSQLSGDYETVKYEMTKEGSSTPQRFLIGEQIKVPLETGSYQVKIVME